MQTIGLIGGMSWESTALYYKLINERVRDRMGKLHSAPLLMYSYDFQEIKEMQYADRWGEAADSLADVARRLANLVRVRLCCARIQCTSWHRISCRKYRFH